MLGTALLFPFPFQFESLRIHQKNSARSVAARRAQCASANAVRPAWDGMRRRVAGLLDELLRLNHFHDLRLPRIFFRVQNVYPRRPDPWHDQVTPLHVRMRILRAEARAASIPTEV